MDVNIQEDVFIIQQLAYDHIAAELRKSCKLAYQKNRLDDQRKKEVRVESETDLKRNHMMDEIENVKIQKMTVVKV